MIIDESTITVNGTTRTSVVGLETPLNIADDSGISMIAGTLTILGGSDSRVSDGDVAFLGTACTVNGNIFNCQS